MLRVLLRNADWTKYGELVKDLAQSYSLGNPQYLDTLQGKTHTLNQHRWDQAYYDRKKQRERSRNDRSSGSDPGNGQGQKASPKVPTNPSKYVVPAKIQATFQVHQHVPRRGLPATFGGTDK